MTYDELNEFCSDLQATSYVVQWGGSHVWKVGGKVFAIGGWEKTGQPAFSFKTSEQNYYFLAAKPGYRPAPYFAARGMQWIQQYNAMPSEDDELRYYLTESHQIVAMSLPKKQQKALGLNQ